MSYRIVIDSVTKYVQLKAAIVEENEGKLMIVGLNDIDNIVRQEENYAKRLAQAQKMANIDALTGVKTKYAYLGEKLDRMIKDGINPDFAIVILDINDLKKVNDTEGHQAGDKYIRDACKIICDTFKRSPVYRVGGDEFLVIVQGEDYTCIRELVEKISDHNAEAIRNGGIVVACGMAEFADDESVTSVFDRADKNMYDNKNRLKAEKQEG